jgi:BirA family transcriptional regulator, biotin operon repressor / biotin---[acetyl-CoA-carboxylase] ligase
VSSADRFPSILRFEILDSTNEEAIRQLASGCETPLWIVAEEQTRGRGRGGRRWHSPKGNLYATLLLKARVTAAVATQLSFVAGLATYDAAASHLSPAALPALRLKWPNDVMLGGAKLAGVLLESLAAPKDDGLAVVLGIGINVSHLPPEAGRPVASLGLELAEVDHVFQSLGASLDGWLARWDDGRTFADIREVWLSRALALHEPISVNLNGSAIRGRFRGLDSAGALQLEIEQGVVITITAGDMYPEPPG